MTRSSSPLTSRYSLLAELARDLRPERLFPAITTGLICGVLNALNVFAFAALFFSGELTQFLPLGIGLILLGDALVCVIAALISSHSSTIAAGQDAPGAILAALIVGILATLPTSFGPEPRLVTIVVLIASTTLFTGICFLVMGYFKLGALVRFLPYPVVGGFLAGTGWPLITGAIGLMTDTQFNLTLLQPAMIIRWLPGIVFAIVLAVFSARISHPLIIPGLTILAVVLFYCIVWLSGTSFSALAKEGWLFEFAAQGIQWQFPFSDDFLNQVDWPALVAAIPGILPILVISVVILLLNVAGTELIVKQDIDLNRELITAGLSNLGGGLAGGIVGFHVISLAGLNHKLSNSSRITGLLTGLLTAVGALIGPIVLAYVPKLVVAGLLAFLGIALILEWIVDARTRFPRFEYGIILVIALVSATFGFLQGLVVGLVAAVLLFVINYSRINVVKHSLTGLTYRSRVTRGSVQRAIIQQHGEQIAILQLQGYLFFGTANSLLEQVRTRVARTDLGDIRYLILDFQQVPGLDSTAILSFAKMQQLAQERGFTLVLTGLAGAVQQSFVQSDLLANTTQVRVFPNLDRGLEWCEEAILAGSSAQDDEAALLDQLNAILARPEQLKRLLTYLERSDVETGDYLIRQGDEPDDMYFVEQGQVTAQLEPAGETPVRLETMRGGRVVGEIGFYLGVRRTAAVRADEPTTIYQLSQAKLQAMERDDPEAALIFHRLIIHLLSERVTHLIRAVDALLR